jgi:hypothetical protein
MQWDFEDFMFSFNYFQIVEVGSIEVVLYFFVNFGVIMV